MTPIVKGIRNFLERAFGSFYEGPEPPERLKEVVFAFTETYPQATRREWIIFAMKHAAEAYRSGYSRGFEWSEREKDAFTKMPPEFYADQIDPDWRWRPYNPDALLNLEEIVIDEVVDLAPFSHMTEPTDDD